MLEYVAYGMFLASPMLPALRKEDGGRNKVPTSRVVNWVEKIRRKMPDAVRRADLEFLQSSEGSTIKNTCLTPCSQSKLQFQTLVPRIYISLLRM